MYQSSGLKLCDELLTDRVSHFGLLDCKLIEYIRRIVWQVVCVFGFLLDVLLITEAISSLTEEFLYFDDTIWYTITSFGKFKLTQCPLMSVYYQLVESDTNNE